MSSTISLSDLTLMDMDWWHPLAKIYYMENDNVFIDIINIENGKWDVYDKYILNIISLIETSIINAKNLSNEVIINATKVTHLKIHEIDELYKNETVLNNRILCKYEGLMCEIVKLNKNKTSGAKDYINCEIKADKNKKDMDHIINDITYILDDIKNIYDETQKMYDHHVTIVKKQVEDFKNIYLKSITDFNNDYLSKTENTSSQYNINKAKIIELIDNEMRSKLIFNMEKNYNSIKLYINNINDYKKNVETRMNLVERTINDIDKNSRVSAVLYTILRDIKKEIEQKKIKDEEIRKNIALKEFIKHENLENKFNEFFINYTIKSNYQVPEKN